MNTLLFWAIFVAQALTILGLFGINKTLEKFMSALDDKITALQTEVTNQTAVDQSAITLINGIAGQIQAAVQAALAQGATQAQLQALTDLQTSLTTNDTSLAAAVAANTQPPPGP